MAPQEKYLGSKATETVSKEPWPSQGGIKFKEVELKYRPNTEIVLRKLNLEIRPGEKVGIVGRTGAGKSTISMALTRIVELFSGSIEIDGFDIAELSISKLRD